MFYTDYCQNKKECLGPYSTTPIVPFNFTRGVTYTNFNYRGGSQREEYKNRCIFIFPNYTPNWPCDFISVGEEKTGYLINHGELPEGIPRCCTMGKGFHAPPKEFTKIMTYNGSSIFSDGREYIRFGTSLPNAGSFEYSFWNIPITKNDETYYEPSFFLMTGFRSGGTPVNISQQFKNFRNEAPPDSVFDIPDACRVNDLPSCFEIIDQ